jgi:quercetin dioxygenase-like cupin family protein
METTMREEIRIGRLAIRFLLEGAMTGGSMAVLEFDVPVGAKVPVAHSHDDYDETMYGVEGVLTVTVEGVPTDVGPGEAVFIPRGAVHHFDNTHDVDATALGIVSPGVLGPQYFRDVAAVVDAAAGGPPDLTAIAAAMMRHGLSPAP